MVRPWGGPPVHGGATAARRLPASPLPKNLTVTNDSISVRQASGPVTSPPPWPHTALTWELSVSVSSPRKGWASQGGGQAAAAVKQGHPSPSSPESGCPKPRVTSPASGSASRRPWAPRSRREPRGLQAAPPSWTPALCSLRTPRSPGVHRLLCSPHTWPVTSAVYAQAALLTWVATQVPASREDWLWVQTSVTLQGQESGAAFHTFPRAGVQSHGGPTWLSGS